MTPPRNDASESRGWDTDWASRNSLSLEDLAPPDDASDRDDSSAEGDADSQDDPATEPFGEPTHAAAKLISPARQRYEAALLRHLNNGAHDKPTLGVCLGMQMMALDAAGTLIP